MVIMHSKPDWVSLVTGQVLSPGVVTIVTGTVEEFAAPLTVAIAMVIDAVAGEMYLILRPVDELTDFFGILTVKAKRALFAETTGVAGAAVAIGAVTLGRLEPLLLPPPEQFAKTMVDTSDSAMRAVLLVGLMVTMGRASWERMQRTSTGRKDCVASQLEYSHYLPFPIYLSCFWRSFFLSGGVSHQRFTS